ncbi:MAG: isoprenylcysteine carboxylmethyltransferase family protein [Deltaproteobacteria bacterium]|nr:isoprenylcysteine carboxylmethyltransferase family protein [Deltaproteobacteria bacterium]
MTPWWLPPLLLLVLALGEWPTWRSYRARWTPSAQDAGTVRVNSLLGNLAFVAGLASGAVLRGVPSAAVPAWLAWSGIPVALAGTALRLWAILTLGRWFTMTIQVRPGQPVVERGPYRVLRHPSYAGGDLAFLGIGLSAGNWVSPLLYFVPWLAAHVHRIGVEERALAATLGEPYRAYQRRTWRLVPFVW